MHRLSIIIIGLICISCSNKSKNKQIDNFRSRDSVVTILNQISENEQPELGNTDNEKKISNPCDSLKVKGFISNLALEDSIPINDEFEKHALIKGEFFINESCLADTLFCDSIYINTKLKYVFDDYTVYSFGFRFNGEQGYENNSNSFYLTQIFKDEKLLFDHIFEELIGEIILELNGIQELNNGVILYGKEFPYFSADYGRFKLSLTKRSIDITHECNEQH